MFSAVTPNKITRPEGPLLKSDATIQRYTEPEPCKLAGGGGGESEHFRRYS